MVKKYNDVNTDKLIKTLDSIFKLNYLEFNRKYGTNIIEKDYEDIRDFVVVKNSKTDNRLDYVEIELNYFTATIFSEDGIERIYIEDYPKSGRRTMKEKRVLMFLKSLLEKCK